MDKDNYTIRNLYLLNIYFRLQVLEEKKHQILNKIKETENMMLEENNQLEKYRFDRNKYQQIIQQIETLKGRIRMTETNIKNIEKERTSIDNIKATYTKEIKVSFYYITYTRICIYNILKTYIQLSELCLYI